MASFDVAFFIFSARPLFETLVVSRPKDAELRKKTKFVATSTYLDDEPLMFLTVLVLTFANPRMNESNHRINPSYLEVLRTSLLTSIGYAIVY
jgi:hypothetical protein